jgi:flagellar protein FliS
MFTSGPDAYQLNSGHDAYLENRILTADPIELVNLLYQGGMQAVREARRHLAEGRIAERSREINKACEILIELATSLDHERGGDISQRLALLYDYMQRRLLEANMQQSDAPLAEVLGLLSTLSEAWAGIRNTEVKPKPVAEIQSSQPAAENPGSQPAAENPWSQPVAESAWSQPAAASPWSQPVAESAWSQPAAASPWSQPVVENAWSQPVAESAWSQPAAQNPWSQPVEEVGCGAQGWSL